LKPEQSPGFLLWRTTLRWQRAITAALKPLGLTHVQFVLLASVWWLSRSQSPSQRELAEHASTDVMMTSQVLRVLEARGLLTRDPDPADARVRRITVTAPGAQLAQRAVQVVEAADRDFFAAAGDGKRLLAVLGDLAADKPASTG
jgi:DNA-binding MarR family transcriptional regulator